MKHTYSLIIGLSLLFAGSAFAQQKTTPYTIEGTIANSDFSGKQLYLLRYDDNQIIDSTLVTGNKFKFTGKTDHDYFCRIDAGRNYANLILEGGDIKVNVDNSNAPSGTPMNDKVRQLFAMQDSLYKLSMKKNQEIDRQTTDIKEQNRLKQEYMQNVTRPQMKRTFLDCFYENSNNSLGEFAIRDLSNMCSPEEMDKVFEKAGPWLMSLNVPQRIQQQFEAMKQTAEGKMFVDFSGTTEDGQPISLSAYVGKGKYTLVDFWASWCKPCREELPNIAEVYNKYKDKGLEVVGIGVWDKPENTKKAIKESNVTWPQILGVGMKPMELYGFSGIPQIILFAPDGTIVERNLRGTSVALKIEEVLSK